MRRLYKDIEAELERAKLVIARNNKTIARNNKIIANLQSALADANKHWKKDRDLLKKEAQKFGELERENFSLRNQINLNEDQKNRLCNTCENQAEEIKNLHNVINALGSKLR